MIKKVKKLNRGYSLVEMIFYISLFAILSLVIFNLMMTMTKSFKQISIKREITQSGEIMERISREIRGAKKINAVADVNGDLKLDSTDDAGASKSIEFLLQNNNLQIIEGQVTPLAVGDNFQGGKIAYILKAGDPGYVADGVTRGFISALSNQSAGGSWWGSTGACANTNINGADGTALGTGLQNTIDMANAGCLNIIQKVYGVNINGYSDWYIPSKDELHKLFINLGITSKLWSSSEISANNAYIEGITYGLPTSDTFQKSNGVPDVHAIRNFTNNSSIYLNSPNIKVMSIHFDQINTTKGQAIKVTLTVRSKHDTSNRDYIYYNTIVLRGDY